MFEQIRDQKKTNPGLFVSGWDVDEEGIIGKDLSDPREQVLTAAEEGELDQLQALLKKFPEFLHVSDKTSLSDTTLGP